MEVMIPPDIVPSEEEIEIIDEGTVVFRPALAQGRVQRMQFAPPRLMVTQRWRALRSTDRTRMLAACSMLNGRYNTARVVAGLHPQGGTLPSTNYLAVSTGIVGASGSLSLVNGERALVRVNVDGDPYCALVATMVIPASVSLVTRAFCAAPSRASSGGNALLAVGWAAPISSYYLTSVDVSTSAQYLVRAYTTNVATWHHSRVFLRVNYLSAIGASFALQFMHAARALSIGAVGASAGDTRIPIVNEVTGFASTGVMVAGDMVEIAGSLYRVATSLSTDHNGVGELQLSTPLYAAVSYGDPVIYSQPSGKFLLAGNPKWSNRYGQYADLEMKFEQIYEP